MLEELGFPSGNRNSAPRKKHSLQPPLAAHISDSFIKHLAGIVVCQNPHGAGREGPEHRVDDVGLVDALQLDTPNARRHVCGAEEAIDLLPVRVPRYDIDTWVRPRQLQERRVESVAALTKAKGSTRVNLRECAPGGTRVCARASV